VSISGPGLIVFLLALFLAALGATVYVVAICRGVGKERQDSDEQ
jgi:hypothetical protein